MALMSGATREYGSHPSAETTPRAASADLLHSPRVLSPEGQHSRSEGVPGISGLERLPAELPRVVAGAPQAVEVAIDALVEDGQVLE
jgi:hypothetical protein